MNKNYTQKELIVGVTTFLIALLGFIKLIYDLIIIFFRDGQAINKDWLYIVITITAVAISLFIMNYLRKRDRLFYNEALNNEKLAHQKTDFQMKNSEQKLDKAMKELVSDFTTGIPNHYSLRSFFEKMEANENARRLQFILIDLKGFKAINDEFMSLKANKLLRFIAQSIYQKMRRDEYLFRLNQGGDEFVVILEGNQPDALGFANRLVNKEFRKLSIESKSILGKHKDLSFHCAIVEMNSKEELDSVRQRAEKDSYSHIDKTKGDFNICWHPNKEGDYPNDSFEKKIYSKTRELFAVHNNN